MMMNLLKFSGYLCYTVFVLFFLLWYKFPAEAVKARIEKDLNQLTPSLHWVVQEIALRPLLDIQLRHISISEKHGEKKEEKTLFRVKTMTLRPDLKVWKKTGNIAAQYKARLLEGTIAGQLGLTKDRSALAYDGAITEIIINEQGLPFLQEQYQRRVQGVLSGTFSGQRKLTEQQSQSVQGTFHLNQGVIGLHDPVLGMKELTFDRSEPQLSLKNNTITLSKGTVTSPLFAATFQGTLHTAVPCPLSRIQVTGSFQPGPEFTASVDSPSLVRMLQKAIQKGNLPFTVNGILQEPGIVFSSLPPAFNRQMGLQRRQQSRQPRLPKRSR